MTLPDKRKWLAKVKEDATRVLAEFDDAFIARLTEDSRRKFKKEIAATIALLLHLQRKVDPVSHPGSIFDPSNPMTVGRMIALYLANRPPQPLVELARTAFYGGGVYALYYRGPHPAYAPITGRAVPIYVGKADPSEVQAGSAEDHGTRLWNRLCKDHLKNIRRAANLNAEDFDCRYLVTQSGYQSAAEAFLIDTYKPVWNKEMKVCFGFGKHGDSADTRKNSRSPWDTLHAGRAWASTEGNTPNPRTAEAITADILRHYKANPPQAMERKMSDLGDILS